MQLNNLSKGEFKSKLSSFLFEYNPHFTIRENDWDRCYHFYLGYIKCFTTIINFPGDENYAHQFVLEESFTFMISLLQT